MCVFGRGAPSPHLPAPQRTSRINWDNREQLTRQETNRKIPRVSFVQMGRLKPQFEHLPNATLYIGRNGIRFEALGVISVHLLGHSRR